MIELEAPVSSMNSISKPLFFLSVSRGKEKKLKLSLEFLDWSVVELGALSCLKGIVPRVH